METPTEITPLMMAVFMGDFQEVETLLHAGNHVDQPSMRGWTPLMMAASLG